MKYLLFVLALVVVCACGKSLFPFPHNPKEFLSKHLTQRKFDMISKNLKNKNQREMFSKLFKPNIKPRDDDDSSEEDNVFYTADIGCSFRANMTMTSSDGQGGYVTYSGFMAFSDPYIGIVEYDYPEGPFIMLMRGDLTYENGGIL